MNKDFATGCNAKEKNVIIGHRIKLLRKRHSISQFRLAMEVNISQRQISHIETGQRELTPENAISIGKYFSVSLDYLYLGISVQNINDPTCQLVINTLNRIPNEIRKEIYREAIAHISQLAITQDKWQKNNFAKSEVWQNIIYFFAMQLDNEDYRKFTKLYEAFHAPLLNYAGTILRDRYLAEEAVHDAFMRIMKNLDKLSENDCSKTWHYMVKVVKNSSLTALRREKANSHQTLNEGGLNEIADYTEPLWSEYQAKELYQKLRTIS